MGEETSLSSRMGLEEEKSRIMSVAERVAMRGELKMMMLKMARILKRGYRGEGVTKRERSGQLARRQRHSQ